MLKPNEVNEKTFEEVGDGVYSAKEVDAFLKEVSSSYEQVFKQNGELVRRLSLLANRLEAFRRQEEQAKKASEYKDEDVSDEAIKNKLEQAKAVAQKMLDDARVKAVGIVNNANKESDRILVDLNDKIREQRVALELLNSKSDSFKKQLLDIYRQHLISIDSIPTQAEKIVKDSATENSAEIKKEMPVYKVDNDDSEIFKQADGFVEKLEEDKAAEELKETEEASVDKNEFVDEAADLSENIVSDDTVFSDSEEVSSAIDSEIDTPTETSVESSPVSDEGFVFDFSSISFDDDDDDDDEVETVKTEDNDHSDSSVEELFTASADVSSDEEEDDFDDLFSSDDKKTDEFVLNENAFLNDDDDEDELDDDFSSESESDKVSFKDLVKSKGNIDSDFEIDFDSDDDNSIDSVDDFSDSFNQED